MSSSNQRQKTQNNPHFLGSFSQTSLRFITGSLGPEHKIGINGYTGGTFNHWYKINITNPAWVILLKGAAKLSTEIPNKIQRELILKKNPNSAERARFSARFTITAYDMNLGLLEPRSIVGERGVFEDQIQSAQADDATTIVPFSNNTEIYNRNIQENDERLQKLKPGDYLICVSSTVNYKITYEIGMVIQYPPTIAELRSESNERELILTEDNQSFVLNGEKEWLNTLRERSNFTFVTAWNRENPGSYPEFLFAPATNQV